MTTLMVFVGLLLVPPSPSVSVIFTVRVAAEGVSETLEN